MTVRKKLIEAGIEIKEQRKNEDKLLMKKVEEMRGRGLSYQAIADIFNLWKVVTRTGEGKWHGKTIRDIKLTRYFLIAAVLQIVWGLTPSASRFVIEEIPVELYITIRWSISGIIFAIYLFLTKSWKHIGLADMGFISLLGLLGYGVASFGTLYGLKLGGVTNFALMAALSPIITSLASVWILKERPHKTFIFSLVVSICGLVFLLVGKYQISTFSITGFSALLILIAYICEALVFVYSKKFKRKMDAPQYLAIAQVSTAIFMWILQGTTFHQVSEISNLSSKGIGGIIFVSIVACVLCYAVLYWLLNYVDGHKLALFDGLHTLSAVFFGYVFFQEEIRWLMVFGGALILVALISGNLPQKKAAEEIPE